MKNNVKALLKSQIEFEEKISLLTKENEELKKNSNVQIVEVWKKKVDALEKEIEELKKCNSLACIYEEENAKLKAALGRMREALEFYAQFESDADGFGGVNGEGQYVIRKEGFQVLDKGKTAQKALKEALSESAWREWREKSGAIKRLEEVVYVPGHHKCPKCNFYLVKSILHPNGICADKSMPEQCPNDGTEMMAVTWKENAQDGRAGQDRLMQIISDKDAHIKSLEAVVAAAREVYDNDDFITDKSDPDEFAKAIARDKKLGEALDNLDNGKDNK